MILLGKSLTAIFGGGGSGGGGDVVGAASSTDNAIARFDGTTGKVIQDSKVSITDVGNVGIGITDPASLLTVNGTIEAGDKSATYGVVLLKAKYNAYPAQTVFTRHSSGGIGLGQYMYQDSSAAWLSSFLGNMPRGALIVTRDTLEFLAAPAQTVTPGSSLTTQPTTVFLVDSAGNFGINIAAPTDKLDVNGSTRFRGAIKDSTGSAGTNGQVLKNVNGLPVWSNP